VWCITVQFLFGILHLISIHRHRCQTTINPSNSHVLLVTLEEPWSPATSVSCVTVGCVEEVDVWTSLMFFTWLTPIHHNSWSCCQHDWWRQSDLWWNSRTCFVMNLDELEQRGGQRWVNESEIDSRSSTQTNWKNKEKMMIWVQNETVLFLVEFRNSFTTFWNGVFRKISWKNKTNSSLDFAWAECVTFVHVDKTSTFLCDTFENIGNKWVHNHHCLVRDADIWVNLLQNLEDVWGKRFGPLLVTEFLLGLWCTTCVNCLNSWFLFRWCLWCWLLLAHSKWNDVKKCRAPLNYDVFKKTGTKNDIRTISRYVVFGPLFFIMCTPPVFFLAPFLSSSLFHIIYF